MSGILRTVATKKSSFLNSPVTGAFWEDRYHATAIECDTHLIRCLIYIDMNMVRAGVIKHPSDWECSGYHEIRAPRQRYNIIDHAALRGLLGFSDNNDLTKSHQNWIEDALKTANPVRESQWTESIAVGDQLFLETIKEKLKCQAIRRSIIETSTGYQLREIEAPYGRPITKETEESSLSNRYPWP